MKQKDFLIILVPAFILTILWVIFSIYHNYATSTIKDPLTYQIAPIVGKFDRITIENIKNRQRINPLYELLSSSESAETSEEELTPTPIPSPTEEVTPTEEIFSTEEITPTEEQILE